MIWQNTASAIHRMRQRPRNQDGCGGVVALPGSWQPRGIYAYLLPVVADWAAVPLMLAMPGQSPLPIIPLPIMP